LPWAAHPAADTALCGQLLDPPGSEDRPDTQSGRTWLSPPPHPRRSHKPPPPSPAPRLHPILAVSAVFDPADGRRRVESRRTFGGLSADFWRSFGGLLAVARRTFGGFWRSGGGLWRLLAEFGGIWRSPKFARVSHSAPFRIWRSPFFLSADFWRSFGELLAVFWRTCGGLLADFGGLLAVSAVFDQRAASRNVVDPAGGLPEGPRPAAGALRRRPRAEPCSAPTRDICARPAGLPALQTPYPSSSDRVGAPGWGSRSTRRMRPPGGRARPRLQNAKVACPKGDSWARPNDAEEARGNTVACMMHG